MAYPWPRVDPRLRARQLLRFATWSEVEWRTIITNDDQAAARSFLGLVDNEEIGKVLQLAKGGEEEEEEEEEEAWPETWNAKKRSLMGALAHFRNVVRVGQLVSDEDRDRDRDLLDVGGGNVDFEREGEDVDSKAMAIEGVGAQARAHIRDYDGGRNMEESDETALGLGIMVLLCVGPTLGVCVLRLLGLL